ncbi:UDP-N-acetylglucosamine 2-epimerase (non-hydrolyzing) [Algoriphagus kandeliae]|uniref:UDP-N-acetylglucosamine 2-epimerase (non-hydrolyzing) n=1 Tax=Algoriphagus kandeliae TaxID=2562278 RepID=A0A4Y9QY53_9BACT|nr:UDP-N-acetylglucosamine 2-epimerase (non-hydrolyzing) [Algoriphagus kandeliae]TFV97411.1 UDP-N-acetylglucosamine 2-epimerase (non-hydrolyzing) [Algoriphagus kandeliae]
MTEKQKILIVFGTRPEAIKMIPLVKELQSNSKFHVKVCVTAQHREMLDQVLNLFQVTPDYDLNIMEPNQGLIDITIKILNGMKKILGEYKPIMVLVHGDTTTCMATSLAAFYFKIKIGHVEAGLRTFDLQSPWPEELNRQITDKISDLYFAPTISTKKNLLKDGVSEDRIVVTGNTVIDALNLIVEKIKNDQDISDTLRNGFNSLGVDVLRKFILVTGHRRENFGIGFMNICKALKDLASMFPNIQIVYPVHLNPNVKDLVFAEIGKIENIKLIPPQEYLPFVYLMSLSYVILTDSGGIQEEGPSLKKPILVMRDTTERPEAVKSGVVKLVGTNHNEIVHNVASLINDPKLYADMISSENPYGDGLASRYIANAIEKYLCSSI